MRKVVSSVCYDEELNTWVGHQDENYRVGVTDWCQGYMGKINSVRFNKSQGQKITINEVFATLESDKVSSDIHSPISGVISKLNMDIIGNSVLINDDCYNKGWLIELVKVEKTHYEQLKDATWYKEAIDSFFRKG